MLIECVRIKMEPVSVCPLCTYNLFGGLAKTVTSFGIDARHNRCVGAKFFAKFVLQLGNQLERVQRDNAIIMVRYYNGRRAEKKKKVKL